jgi:membrane fusion protein, copper/silver efflux system
MLILVVAILAVGGAALLLVPWAGHDAKESVKKPGTSVERDLPSGGNHAVVQLSEHARSMGAVETVPVEWRNLEATIRAVGKIHPNETTLASVVSRVDGYVERLFVNFTGVEVRKGDHLIEIYSPDLVVAQQELLLRPGPSITNLTEGSRLKLTRLGLTSAQVDELLKNRNVTDRVTLFSPIHGTVLEKMVVQNSAVKAGDVLYRLASLDSVWVYLDIYEYELERIQYGRSVELTSESYPGETFAGRVWFISPVLSEETRTIKVLVNIQNRDRKLKPGMYVSAALRVPLMANGRPAPTGVEGQWTCPMHPSVIQPGAGKCPVCAMDLVQIPGVAEQPSAEKLKTLAVPVTAVLDSGLRKLVYVERAPGEYVPVEVTLGSRAGEFFPVLKGLASGDRVVTRGTFLLDSQFQIQGLASLFYPTGQIVSGDGHQHIGSTKPKSVAAEN